MAALYDARADREGRQYLAQGRLQDRRRWRTWLTGSYDAATDTLFWGVGNPGPWLATLRPGTNLYTDSVIAMNPASGAIKCSYQYTPHDTWDYDGTNETVLTDITYQGTAHKAIVSASRNGWFYAIDRENGKLIYATKFATATSVNGVKNGQIPPPTTSCVPTWARKCSPARAFWAARTGGRSPSIRRPTSPMCRPCTPA